MVEKTILIIVPGRDDRAFYKAFIMKILSNFSLNIVDLDSNNNITIKKHILNKIFPHESSTSPIIKGTSSISISRSINSTIYFIIIPSEGNVTLRACDILNHLGGLMQNNGQIVDAIIIAEDAEDIPFIDRLNSLRDSLKSHKCITINDKNDMLERGNYYLYYSLQRPPGIKLLIIVQGLTDVELVDKHAIEDFAIYPFINDEILENLYAKNLDILNGRNKHKKLALLVALSKCQSNIEELFHRVFTKKETNLLKEKHDGLNMILKIVQELLNNE